MKTRLEISCPMTWTNIRARGNIGGWKRVLGHNYTRQPTPVLDLNSAFEIVTAVNVLIHETNRR